MKARALMDLHHWQAAESLLRKVVELDPRDSEAPWLLFDMFTIEIRPNDAFDLAVQLHPKQRDPAVSAVLLLEAMRQELTRPAPTVVINRLESVRVREPNNATVLAALGTAYVQVKRVTEGLELLERASTLAPAQEVTWFKRLAALLDLGRFDDAERLWGILPAAAKDWAGVQRLGANVAESRGDPVEAERRCRRAIAADPFDRKTQAVLSGLRRRRGAVSEADAVLAQSIKIDDARELLAKLYHQALAQYDRRPPADLCRRIGECWRAMGHAPQADCWQEEANRQHAPGRN